MDVVRVITLRIHALRRAASKVRLIDRDRLFVRLQRFFVLSDAEENVERHVDDVSGAGHLLAQSGACRPT